MTEYTHSHAGSCECGAVRFTFHCSSDLSALAARACQCEYCLPRRMTYISDSAGQLEVVVRDRRYLYAHSFGTRSADFMHCARCNALVYVKCLVDEHEYALVVANSLLEFAAAGDAEPVDFDTETLPERLRRRATSWIPQLEVIESGV